jgi:hypothetical protein
LVDVSVDGEDFKMDLIEIVRESVESSDTGQGPVVGSCEHDNALSAYTRGGEFLDLQSDYQLPTKDSVP